MTAFIFYAFILLLATCTLEIRALPSGGSDDLMSDSKRPLTRHSPNGEKQSDLIQFLQSIPTELRKRIFSLKEMLIFRSVSREWKSIIDVDEPLLRDYIDGNHALVQNCGKQMAFSVLQQLIGEDVYTSHQLLDNFECLSVVQALCNEYRELGPIRFEVIGLFSTLDAFMEKSDVRLSDFCNVEFDFKADFQSIFRRDESQESQLVNDQLDHFQRAIYRRSRIRTLEVGFNLIQRNEIVQWRSSFNSMALTRLGEILAKSSITKLLFYPEVVSHSNDFFNDHGFKEFYAGVAQMKHLEALGLIAEDILAIDGLDVYYLYEPREKVVFDSILAHKKSVKWLKIEYVAGDRDNFLRLVEQMQALEYLYIDYFSDEHDLFSQSIPENWKAPSTLKVVKIIGILYDHDHGRILGNSESNLAEFEVRFFATSNDNVRRLADGIRKQTSLKRILIEEQESIYHDVFQSEKLTDETIQYLASALIEHPSLNDIDLPFLELSQQQARFFHPLVESSKIFRF